MLIPFKFLNIFQNQADDEVEELMIDELSEITQFNFNSLTYINRQVSVERYIQDQQRVAPLRPAQVDAITFGINQNGRVFLADDKVNITL